MPKYFVHLDRTNAPSNALQRAAADHLRKIDGHIISGHQDFVAGLKDAIAGMNNEHSRCTPLTVHSWSTGRVLGISLGDHFMVGFYLYQIKEDTNV